ncbi:hypothetical protein VCV18_001967 [Metarhizium anisopliae]
MLPRRSIKLVENRLRDTILEDMLFVRVRWQFSRAGSVSCGYSNSWLWLQSSLPPSLKAKKTQNPEDKCESSKTPQYDSDYCSR